MGKKILNKYSGLAKNVLELLIEKYSSEGTVDLLDTNLLRIKPFNQYGTPVEIINSFGSLNEYNAAVNTIQSEIYQISI